MGGHDRPAAAPETRRRPSCGAAERDNGNGRVRAMLIDAVAVVRARHRQLNDDTYAAIAAAREAGTSQRDAHLANAMERLRVSRILPCLADNDRLRDRLRVSQGLASQLACSLTEREVSDMTDRR